MSKSYRWLEVLTNVAYPMAAAYSALAGNWAVAILFVILGVTSFGYHYFDTKPWQRADVASLLALLLGLILVPGVGWWGLPVSLLIGAGIRYHLIKDLGERTAYWTAPLGALALLRAALVNPVVAAISGGLLLVFGVLTVMEKQWKWAHGIKHIFGAAGCAALSGV